MNTIATKHLSRRRLLQTLGQGSLVVAFELSPFGQAAAIAKGKHDTKDGHLSILSGINSGSPPQNYAWLSIDGRNRITFFSGKVELGTGTQTAFSQIVAEELYVDVSAIRYVQGDTGRTPDQGFTAGSKSIQVQGPLVRRAAATAFQKLLDLAAAYLGVPASQLVARDGSIGVGPHMQHRIQYGALLAGQQISLTSNSAAAIKPTSAYTIVGKSTPRVDLPDKLAGQFTFVTDVVLPGMLHGRVVRSGKHKNASFLSLDDSAARGVAGFVQTIQTHNFVGVVATTEWGAIQAAKNIVVTWNGGAPLVSDYTQASLEAALENPGNAYATSMQEVVGNADTAYAAAPLKFTRSYFTPYHMHGSVGPSCAVAHVTSEADADGVKATIWSSTQGVYPLQLAISDILGSAEYPPASIRVIYVEGAGCYGHNGADDAAADAALMSKLSGKPVRVQWMRQDEHGWEPLGPAMSHKLQAGLDAMGNVVSWSHELWSPPHNSRPGGGGSLLAGQEIGLFPPNLPVAPVNLATRNGPVTYSFPAIKLVAHHVQPYQSTAGVAAHPLVNTLPRSSALRSLGGMSNCFANESFVDEIARAANIDPIAFRKKYVCTLNPPSSGSPLAVPAGYDQRAAAALDALASQAGWGGALSGPLRGDHVGKGVAFARYETVETYVAVYAEVEVTSSTGDVWVRRVVVVHDCGLVINPDGLKNQIEGNVIQGISRTLIEEVGFDTSGVTSLLWASQSPTPPPGTTYPVIHFDQTPKSIEIVLLNHPEQLSQTPDTPAWGAGEPTIGPVAPAIGNAIFDAIGKRLAVLPITRQRVLSALA